SVRYPSVATPNDPSIDPDDGMTANPWPSSDWMADVAERGAPAAACLFVTFVGLCVTGVLAMSPRADSDEFAQGLVLVATTVTVVVAGAFDALLLLPAPALRRSAGVSRRLPPCGGWSAMDGPRHSNAPRRSTRAAIPYRCDWPRWTRTAAVATPCASEPAPRTRCSRRRRRRDVSWPRAAFGRASGERPGQDAACCGGSAGEAPRSDCRRTM